MISYSDNHFTVNFNKGVFAFLIFIAAYMTTITVNAQSAASKVVVQEENQSYQTIEVAARLPS